MKRGEKYKFFKFRFTIKGHTNSRAKLILKALDEMPNIEVEKMIIKSGDNELLDILASKPSFKTKKNLFKVLEYRVDYYDKPEPLEYVSYINGNSRKAEKI